MFYNKLHKEVFIVVEVKNHIPLFQDLVKDLNVDPYKDLNMHQDKDHVKDQNLYLDKDLNLYLDKDKKI